MNVPVALRSIRTSVCRVLHTKQAVNGSRGIGLSQAACKLGASRWLGGVKVRASDL